MNVWMIWASDGADNPTMWLVEAWDDDSYTSNHDGWLEALANAEENHGARLIRITKTTVNFDKVIAAFEPVTV